jgi:hypothetical protein
MKPVQSMFTLSAEPTHYPSQSILSIRENSYGRFGSTPSTPQHGLYFLLGPSVQIAHNSERFSSPTRLFDTPCEDFEMLPPLLSFTLCFDKRSVYSNREMVGLVLRRLRVFYFPAQFGFNGHADRESSIPGRHCCDPTRLRKQFPQKFSSSTVWKIRGELGLQMAKFGQHAGGQKLRQRRLHSSLPAGPAAIKTRSIEHQAPQHSIQCACPVILHISGRLARRAAASSLAMPL